VYKLPLFIPRLCQLFALGESQLAYVQLQTAVCLRHVIASLTTCGMRIDADRLFNQHSRDRFGLATVRSILLILLITLLYVLCFYCEQIK